VGWAKTRMQTEKRIELHEQIVCELDDLFVGRKRHVFLLAKRRPGAGIILLSAAKIFTLIPDWDGFSSSETQFLRAHCGLPPRRFGIGCIIGASMLFPE
jgi:hypothetical protein